MNLVTFIFLLFLQAISSQRQRPTRLSPMSLNANHITLSGFSSGGAFAQQFQLSYSNLFDGIAIFSDTYYRCGSATGRIEDYESACTKLSSNQRSRRDFNVSNAISELQRNALAGLIDNPANLLNTRLFVFAGTRSSKFTTDQSLRILDIYEPFIQNLSNIYVEVQISENVLPSNNFGGNCHEEASRNFHIANCNFSGAYESLRFLLRNLLRFPERNIAVHPLDQFDQSEFFNGIDGNYMDRIGFMYIPSGCRDSSINCLLHFYFHGCSNGREFNGTSHIVNSGFLQVAEANDIVMIFPQTLSSDDNEEGCWDTFGLTGKLFATRSGRQIEIMRKILERLIPSLTRSNPSGSGGTSLLSNNQTLINPARFVLPPLNSELQPVGINGLVGAEAFEFIDREDGRDLTPRPSNFQSPTNQRQVPQTSSLMSPFFPSRFQPFRPQQGNFQSPLNAFDFQSFQQPQGNAQPGNLQTALPQFNNLNFQSLGLQNSQPNSNPNFQSFDSRQPIFNQNFPTSQEGSPQTSNFQTTDSQPNFGDFNGLNPDSLALGSEPNLEEVQLEQSFPEAETNSQTPNVQISQSSPNSPKIIRIRLRRRSKKHVEKSVIE